MTSLLGTPSRDQLVARGLGVPRLSYMAVIVPFHVAQCSVRPSTDVSLQVCQVDHPAPGLQPARSPPARTRSRTGSRTRSVRLFSVIRISSLRISSVRTTSCSSRTGMIEHPVLLAHRRAALDRRADRHALDRHVLMAAARPRRARRAPRPGCAPTTRPRSTSRLSTSSCSSTSSTRWVGLVALRANPVASAGGRARTCGMAACPSPNCPCGVR